MSRIVLFTSWLVAVAGFVLVQQPLVQSQGTPKAPPPRTFEERLQMSLKVEKPGLADAYRGITTHGKAETGLFPVRTDPTIRNLCNSGDSPSALNNPTSAPSDNSPNTFTNPQT